jgi:hypothetical protein
MFPTTTSTLRREISRKSPVIERRENGWEVKLFENLNTVRNILDTLYEYIYNAAEPSAKNLDDLLKELNEVRNILRGNVVSLGKKLKPGDLSLLPVSWSTFANNIQNETEINFLGLQRSLRLYAQLVKAKPKTLNKKNMVSLRKDLNALESQREEFLIAFWRFKSAYSNYLDAMR